jgi:NADH dehydrogenase
MLLLTGATGLIGSALLRRLIATDTEVRCLVRDPRRLGVDRVRVQIAIGNLTEPQAFRNALRGVDTVVHLAASIRDQPGASLEELNGLATWRLVEAAKRAGVKHFVFFSALGATSFSPARFMRTKAVAEEAVMRSGLGYTIFAPSIVYAPGDQWLTLLAKLAKLGVMPLSGSGQAPYQPIWADDVARCVMAVLAQGPADARYEIAGPQTLTHEQIVRLVLQSKGLKAEVVNVPFPLVKRFLRIAEVLLGSNVFATADEAELLEIAMVSEFGSADTQRLGVTPLPMAEVLGIDH